MAQEGAAGGEARLGKAGLRVPTQELGLWLEGRGAKEGFKQRGSDWEAIESSVLSDGEWQERWLPQVLRQRWWWPR